MEKEDFDYLIPIWRGLFRSVRREVEEDADEFFMEAGITPTPVQHENKCLEIFVVTGINNPHWRERLLRYFVAE